MASFASFFLYFSCDIVDARATLLNTKKAQSHLYIEAPVSLQIVGDNLGDTINQFLIK